MSFPILQNATTLMDFALGKNVELFRYDMPTLSAGFKYTEQWDHHIDWWIKGEVEISADFSVSADASVSFTTAGFESGDILDGLVVSATSSVHVGVDIDAGGAIDLLGFEIAGAGLTGGVDVNITGTWDTHTGNIEQSGDASYSMGYYVKWKNIDPFSGSFGETERFDQTLSMGNIDLW